MLVARLSKEIPKSEFTIVMFSPSQKVTNTKYLI